jgi:hypothetical protein
VLLCKRCNRRHPDGTEWCTCGAYLPFESEQVDEPPAAPAEPEPARPLRHVDQAEPAAAPATGDEQDGAAAVATRTGPEVEAVLPDRPIQRRDAPVTPAERAARTGDVSCPRCQTSNEPTLNFCRRCGNPLSAVADLTVSGGTHRGGWFRSWWDKLRGRVPDDPSRAAMQGNRLFRKGLSWRSRLFRVGLVGGVGVAALAMIHPSLRPRVLDAVKDALPGNQFRVVSSETYEVENRPEGGEIPDRGAALVVDRAKNTSWAAEWNDPTEGMAEAPVDGACHPEPSAATGSLRFTFEDETDLARLRIVPGRWDGDETRANFPRPRLVELRYSDGTCQFIVVEDEGVEQGHPVEAEDLTDVEIRILGVYRGQQADNEVAITEIAFDRGR